jgi:hypothetical protein
MGCKSITDPVEGYGAIVDAGGNLHVSVQDLPEPVEGRPFESGAVTTTTATVSDTASAPLVAANNDRRQIDIQNLSGTRAVHLLFAGSGSATTSHFRLDPGARYSFPPGVGYTGAIQAIAVGGSAAVVVHEFTA